MVLLKLTIVKGDTNNRFLTVTEKKISIRRANPKNLPTEKNLVFDSKVMSRHHAEVWLENNVIYIQDVGSSNGTLVNDVRLKANEPQAIQDQDHVQFGEDFSNVCTCVVAKVNIIDSATNQSLHTDEAPNIAVARETGQALDQISDILGDLESGVHRTVAKDTSGLQERVDELLAIVAKQTKEMEESQAELQRLKTLTAELTAENSKTKLSELSLQKDFQQATDSITDLEQKLSAMSHTPTHPTHSTHNPSPTSTRACIELEDDIEDEEDSAKRRGRTNTDSFDRSVQEVSLAWAAVVRPNVLASIVFANARPTLSKVDFHGSTMV